MSLKFEKNPNENSSFAISGRLDSVTAPELEKELSAVINESTSLVIDMKKLEYISSAGLRIILKTHKALMNKGGLKLINVPGSVMEVFNITGFSDFLIIE